MKTATQTDCREDNQPVVPVELVSEARTKMQPEKRLLGAMLADAARIYLTTHGDGRTGKLVREIESWLASDAGAPFSFRTVCEHLGLDHTAARGALVQRRLASLERRAVAERPPRRSR